MKNNRMDDDELLAVLMRHENTESVSTGNGQSQQAYDRAAAHRRYLRRPQGDEVEGRSSVVSSDTFNMVEWMLPSIIDVFISSDQAVQFQPRGAEDVAAAEQRTDVCNYVFYTQNNGFLVLYTWIKDALMYRNGHVTWRYETKNVVSEKKLARMTEDMLLQHLIDPATGTLRTDVQVVEKKEYQGQAMGGDGLPVTVLFYDVTLRETTQQRMCKIINIPPEELILPAEHNSILLDDCEYICWRTEQTAESLKAMGLDFDEELEHGTDDLDSSPERQERFRASVGDLDEGEEYQLRIEYVLVDYDGDGIVERRCIHRVGSTILKNEICTHVPFASFTPIVMQHQFNGLSVDDMTADLQEQHTAILRQMLDGLYLTNDPRMAVLTNGSGEMQANLDDLLNSRPGGIVREKVAGAVRPLSAGWPGAQALPMLDYLDNQREARTGFSRRAQGLDKDSLNQTFGGIRVVTQLADMRMKLIARIFAEVGLKPLFKGILKCLSENNEQEIAFKLRGQFVQINPSEWRDSYDVTTNVGLGTGDRDARLGHLNAISQAQQAAVQAGAMGTLVTMKQIYNTQKAITENAGFKTIGEFWQDPEGPEARAEAAKKAQQPPAPDPETAKLQAQMQIEQLKAQSAMQVAQVNAQLQKELEQMRLASAAQIEQMREQMKAVTAEKELAVKQREISGNYELQRSNDERQAQLDSNKAQLAHEAAANKAKMDVEKAVLMAQLGKGKSAVNIAAGAPPDTDANRELAQQAQTQEMLRLMLQAVQQLSAPKRLIHDNNGRVIGVKGLEGAEAITNGQ
jgi:hypothetical protein